MIIWHRRAGVLVLLALGGDRGEGLVTGAGRAGVVTEHHSPDWLDWTGGHGVPAGADALTPHGEGARARGGAQVPSPGGVGRFLEQIDGFLNGF